MKCPDCERCTWNPGPDCRIPDHPHCFICGHCQYRHRDQHILPARFVKKLPTPTKT